MTGFTTAVVTLFFASIQCYKHCHSSMHLITLNSPKHHWISEKAFNENGRRYGCGMHSTLMEENSEFVEDYSGSESTF